MSKRCVWLIQASENLPIDSDIRLLRTGIVAEELHRRGYEVIWFASRFQHSNKKHREISEKEINIASGYKLILLPGPGYSSNISLARIFHNSIVAVAFLRIAKRFPQPALILCSYPSPELCSSATWFARRFKIPIFFDVRDSWPDTFGRYLKGARRALANLLSKYYRLHIRYAFSHCNGLLAMGREMQRWALGYSGRKPRSIDRVFHLGAAHVQDIPIGKFKAVEFTKESPLRCVFVASFGYSYDGLMIVNAARQLFERGVEKIEIVMIGDGEFRSEWEAAAKGLPNIHFTGWLSRAAVSAELHRSHIGIAAYRGGILDFALPNKFFDYLSFGLALASTIPNEGREILEQNEIGAFIEPGDATTLANIFVKYAEDPKLLATTMKRAYDTFERDFRADKIYRKYVDVVGEFLGEKFDTNAHEFRSVENGE